MFGKKKQDVDRLLPGTLHAIREWFRTYKVRASSFLDHVFFALRWHAYTYSVCSSVLPPRPCCLACPHDHHPPNRRKAMLTTPVCTLTWHHTRTLNSPAQFQPRPCTRIHPQIPDGKPENKFALGERFMGVTYTMRVIRETHEVGKRSNRRRCLSFMTRRHPT